MSIIKSAKPEYTHDIVYYIL